MAEKKTEAAVALAENELLLRFNKPYVFEGKTYESIDLSALETLTTADMCRAQKMLDRNGGVTVLPETNPEYACIVAHIATGQPLEFFQGLPAREGVKLKNQVSGYFFGED